MSGVAGVRFPEESGIPLPIVVARPTTEPVSLRHLLLTNTYLVPHSTMRRIRTSNTTAANAPLSRRIGFVGAPHDSWRAILESQLVRRVIRGARLWDSARLGEGDTLAVLERGFVSEVLETRRFVENHPAVARRINDVASARGTCVTVIAGIAAFELDFVADGVGALLREAPWRTSGMLA